ncbi:hypothetical protein MPSEU_000675200 [Mayamaea pseudoterrestris]|nr:hypothetical protein MPSEU_000675200 [Mayamaea pseudoterrestris]
MSAAVISPVPFTAIFVGALICNALATFRSSELYKSKFAGSKNKANNIDSNTLTIDETREYNSLLRKYLVVYLLATASDWLQGPYVYALYSDYGYSQHEIAVLFVAGFGSSMVFGSFVGGMADWGGRKRFVLVFCLVYAASCMTKHFRNFKILMLGRLLGGIATSLLFSVFEAWLIRSHSNLRLKHCLGKSFAWASYGNSVIAIAAGLVANGAASKSKMTATSADSIFYTGGYLNPFDIALTCLLICGAVCYLTWEENFGTVDQTEQQQDVTDTSKTTNAKWYDGLRSAFVTTTRNMDVLLCGLISSLFEGSMYIFVFMWTPALSSGGSGSKDAPLPFGQIFATFMVCCMCGASLFGIATERVKGESLAVAVFGLAALAMGSVAVSTSKTTKFLAMNVFEMTVGMYWPLMGTMKGMIVPESKRAAIYNLFRIPLNFIVLFSLLTDLTPRQSFALNCIMLGTASVLQYVLMKRREASSGMDASTEQASLLLTSSSLGSVDEEFKDADV